MWGTGTARMDRPAGSAKRHVLLACLLALVAALAFPPAALALEAIAVKPDDERIDLTMHGQRFEARGDKLLVETAPGADGIVGRIEVKAVNPGTNPNWVVFALKNTTDKPVERWLTAERYSIVGSGLVLPDLDAPRLRAVTPSLGFVPEAIPSDRTDIFSINLDPGQTITYVVEIASDGFPAMYLWKPQVFEKKLRDRALFNGIMLGFTGLLAIFLTSIFAANHKAIFPSAALVAWSALAYFCIDFGFWHKIFQLPPADNALYRAAAEAAIVASLVVFLYAFLRLGLWHRWVRAFFLFWMLGQLVLVAAAVIDPKLAATFARLSFLLLASIGSLFVLYLSLRGQDRALAIVPSWLFFLVWLFGAAVAVSGRLNGELVTAGLVSGLVVILVLMSFTVTQFAFRSIEPVYAGGQGEVQTRALAIEGANTAVWEWNSRRDEIHTGPLVEELLGLSSGELNCRVDDWAKHVHPSDRERFRLMLVSLQERNGGTINLDLRMRRNDSSYRWFELRAASVPQTDPRTLRCVGLLRDVTSMKRAHERLVHDAIHDSLTGLPNRELFLDRLGVAIARAKQGQAPRPTAVLIDIDRFKSVNSAFGLIVADSMLLTIARRLQRHVGAQDTIARVAGDQFAVLITAEHQPRDVAMLAERVRRSLRTPMKIAGKEIVLTGSVGIAVYDGEQASAHDMLREAEAALHRAKRGGADRIEIFNAAMRGEADQRVALESELRKAVERRQLRILYQPIMRLANDDLAGFEALVRWNHPSLGELGPAEFIPLAEEAGLVTEIGAHVLARAAKEAARWHKALPRSEDPLFVSVNVSSRQLFRQDLVQEIRNALGRDTVPKGTLKLEITESLVMENPERAAEVLEWLRAAGAGLSLDDFGTGYSSLSYLSRFAFDTIKIDRSLIHEAASDPAGMTIVRSIVVLARELGKSVVAEGVETPEDATFLRSIGCEYAQGFYYGEPMSEGAVIEALEAIHKADKRAEKRGGLLASLPFFKGGRSAEAKPEGGGDARSSSAPSRPQPMPAPVHPPAQAPTQRGTAPAGMPGGPPSRRPPPPAAGFMPAHGGNGVGATQRPPISAKGVPPPQPPASPTARPRPIPPVQPPPAPGPTTARNGPVPPRPPAPPAGNGAGDVVSLPKPLGIGASNIVGPLRAALAAVRESLPGNGRGTDEVPRRGDAPATGSTRRSALATFRRGRDNGPAAASNGTSHADDAPTGADQRFAGGRAANGRFIRRPAPERGES